MRRLTLFLTLLFSGAWADSSAGVGAPAAGPEAARAELLETDARFSQMSVSRGVPAAFLAFMDDDAVILPPGLAPIRGRDAIAAYYEKTPSGTVLEWKPLAAEVSRGEDLGYTYGTYDLRGTDTQGKPVTRSGKYISVWKKQPDDSWRWALDMGNIDPPSPSPGGAGPAEATIRALEVEGRTAALSGDPEAHDRLLAADWTNINSNGTVTTKPQLLALLKSSPFTFLSIEDEDASVRIYGEAAVVTGRSTRKREGRPGEPSIAQTVRFTRVYAERDGRWQVVSAQTTPIGRP